MQNMFALCEAKNVTEIDELLQVGVKTDSGSGGWQGSGQRGEKLED